MDDDDARAAAEARHPSRMSQIPEDLVEGLGFEPETLERTRHSAELESITGYEIRTSWIPDPDAGRMVPIPLARDPRHKLRAEPVPDVLDRAFPGGGAQSTRSVQPPRGRQRRPWRTARRLFRAALRRAVRASEDQ